VFGGGGEREKVIDEYSKEEGEATTTPATLKGALMATQEASPMPCGGGGGVYVSPSFCYI
jgi:hypothetical protein